MFLILPLALTLTLYFYNAYNSLNIRFRSAIAKGRYRKDPHMQNSMCKLKLTLTLVLTLTDTGSAVLTLMLGYRSLYITRHGSSGHL